MATKAIKLLSDDPSKEEEIEFFNAIVEMVPSKAYLYDFFSYDMIKWVQSAIKADFALDIHKFYEEVSEENRVLEKRIDEIQEQHLRALEVIQKTNPGKISQLEKDLEQMTNECISWKDASEKHWLAFNKQLETTDDLKDQVDQQALEILQLKAKLYDYIAK